MTTFRTVLLAMTFITIVLIAIASMMEYNFLKIGKFALRNPFKRKPKSESEPQQKFSFFDKLVDLIGNDVISVYNGVTYSLTRNERDADDQPLNLGTDKWFKIKIGKYVSGLGDWGGGFDRASCAVAEVYVDNNGKVLHVCAGYPYYNSPTKQADEALHEKVKSEIDKIRQHLSSTEYVKLETKDQWLNGVLDTIHNVTYIGEADLWKHVFHVTKRK